MGRRIWAAALGIFAALALSGGAQAAPYPTAIAPTDCDPGQFCMYENAYAPYFYSGHLPGSWPRNGCTATPNNRLSYVFNNTGTRWFLFRDSACAGAHLEVPAGGWNGPVTTLINGTTWDNDTIRVMRTSIAY